MEKSWDTRHGYFDFFGDRVGVADAECEALKQSLPLLHEVFSSVVAGEEKSYLDFSCGPNISNVVSASRVYGHIVLSEFGDMARDDVNKWLQRAPDAYDWSLVFRKVSEMEGSLVSPEQVEQRVRYGIKNVVPCDILADDPLLASHVPRDYDAISAFQVLRIACPEFTEYKAAVKKLVNMLRPGGLFLVSENLNETFWNYGEKTYRIGSLNEEKIREALGESGLRVLRFKTFPLCKMEHYNGTHSGFIVAAKDP